MGNLAQTAGRALGQVRRLFQGAVGLPGRTAARRLSVWQRHTGGWDCVEGEVGGPAPRILRAFTVEAGQLPGEDATPDDADVVLVARSHRSICRELELPTTSVEDARRMLALRLEAELPYDVSAALWSFDLRPGPRGGGSRAFVTAMPSEDVAADEAELREAGLSCATVEPFETALAQLAALLAPDAEAVAIVEAAGGRAALAAVQGGKVSYARTIAHGPAQAADAAHLAEEAAQSLQHYALDAGAGVPARVIVVGESGLAERTAAALTELGVEGAELAGLPDALGADWADGDDRTFRRYAGCIGALIAAHCRLRDGRAAGPALRLAAGPGEGRARRTRVTLAAANVLLALALVASAFGVRSIKLSAATEAIDGAKALSERTELLEEEIRILEREHLRGRATLDLLKAVVEALPEGQAVKEITVDDKGTMSIQGLAPSVEAASQTASALTACGLFEDVQLLRVWHERDAQMFRIACAVRQGGAERR